MSDCNCEHYSLNRRDLIRAGLIGFTGYSLSQGLLPVQAFALPQKRKAKNMIMLWMSGGPSQIDTWDPKPGEANGGPTKALETNVKGFYFSENFPTLARDHGDKIAVIRSLVTNIVDHRIGAYVVHTSYAPDPSVLHPAIGSIVCKEGFQKEDPLPGFISVGGGTNGEGFLSATYGPFSVGNPMAPVPNLNPWRGVDRKRMVARVKLLAENEKRFKKPRKHPMIQKRNDIYGAAFKMMEGEGKKAFDVSQEPEKIREMYGMNRFGQGLLMARRLIQTGVQCVEVRLGGWDTHNENFTRVPQLCAMVDQGWAALLTDLKAEGMLDDTLMVWAGEFGRTPRINATQGRDHWGRCWSIAMAGAGIGGGQAVGATNKDCTQVAERPVDIREIFATIYDRLGIDSRRQNYSPNGRPIRYVKDDIDGEKVTRIKPLKEIL